MKRLVFILLFFLGCGDTIVEAPPFPLFSVMGEWKIHWVDREGEETGVVWYLAILEQRGHVFYGELQPDPAYEYYYEIMGGVYEGYRHFAFSMRDVNYIYSFDCIMRPSLIRFDGVCRLYDAFTGVEMALGAEFYGVKVGFIGDQGPQ